MHQIHSTIITAQLPVSAFHQYLNEPTVADAILDRLLHRCHRIDLGGDSLRKRKPPATDSQTRKSYPTTRHLFQEIANMSKIPKEFGTPVQNATLDGTKKPVFGRFERNLKRPSG
jgi:hypothetical protein